MHDTPCISFDGVWKKFRRGEVHNSLRDLVPAIGRKIVGRGPAKDSLDVMEFWALEDVSFRVDPGCALGIIGANGAGKSTVLKTLTRILRPNRGECRTVGRIGSLIEIAAGFHQDLTGRENVFLQGAIMGMPTDMIHRRFDEIVEFSGISEFIDTPVKRYSTGMNARLGFSIAAHLHPDILVVDEVLAVGDVSFQQKAFGRIRSLVTSGIPVVIVSHQLERIAELCTRCILLEHGRVLFDGDPAACIGAYVSGISQGPGAEKDLPIRLHSITARGDRNVQSGNTVELTLEGEVVSGEAGELGVRVRAAQTGNQIFATTNGMCQVALPKSGPFSLSLTLQMNVAPGVYAIEPYLVVWKQGREQFLSAGPVTHVQVLPDRKFWGIHQLNPRMTLSTSPPGHEGTLEPEGSSRKTG